MLEEQLEMKKKLSAYIFAVTIFATLIMVPLAGQAERTKVVVIEDIVAVDCEVSEEDLIKLTESVYAAATEVSPERFSIVSREKTLAIAQTIKTEDGEADKNPWAILGADMVFVGELRQQGVRYDVTLKLMETGSGRILGLERASAQGMDGLWNEVRKAARLVLMPLATADLAAPTQEAPIEETAEVREDFLVQIRATPADADVFMDGTKICGETPCSYRVEPGDHVFVVDTKYHESVRRREIIDGPAELEFKLKPKKYNYPGMHDAAGFGYGVTVGVSPLDPDYKAISVINGVGFNNLHPVFDVGFGGEVFGYHQTPHDSSWSILGFGPAFRLGRLMISSQVQLLSFRPDNKDEYEDGWLPGITVRAQFPIVNSREVGGWAALIPTPTIGYDVWFTDLDYDQQNFWLGASWLGGVGH